MLQHTETPIYRILATQGFFGPDDHLYPEGSVIRWSGEPNEDMEPLNEPAIKAMNDFFDKLEDHAKALAKKAGVEYTGRPRSLEAAVHLSTLAARRTSTNTGDGGVPLMGADKSEQKETIGFAQESNAAPETPQQATRPQTKRGKGALAVSAPPVTPLSKLGKELLA